MVTKAQTEATGGAALDEKDAEMKVGIAALGTDAKALVDTVAALQASLTALQTRLSTLEQKVDALPGTPDGTAATQTLILEIPADAIPEAKALHDMTVQFSKMVVGKIRALSKPG